MKYRTWSLESGVWSLEWEILDTHGYMGTWLLEGINTEYLSTYVCEWGQKEMYMQGCTPSVKARWHREKQNKTKRERRGRNKVSMNLKCGIRCQSGVWDLRYPVWKWKRTGSVRGISLISLISLSLSRSLSGRASSPQSVLGGGRGCGCVYFIHGCESFGGRASAAWGLVSVVAAWLGLDLAWIMDDVWIASAFGNRVRICDVRSR